VAGRESKVLWRPQNGYHDPVLQITATRLDAATAPLAWTFPHATLDQSGPTDAGYPSGITLPTVGCWRLAAHIGTPAAGVTVLVRN